MILSKARSMMLHNKIEMFSIPGFMMENFPQDGTPPVDSLSQMTLDEKTCQLVTFYGYPGLLIMLCRDLHGKVKYGRLASEILLRIALILVVSVKQKSCLYLACND